MKFTRIMAILLVLVMCLSSCYLMIACGNDDDKTDDPQTPADDINETKTLILQSSTMDGVFNPFFYSSAYDEEVIAMCNVGLLSMDRTGAIVAGDEYNTVAKSYSIYYTNDLTNYTKKETYETGDYVVYEIVVKNGMKFSDGSAVTAEDVLFNYYVYLDPAYVGSSTLYTLPIYGLADYRTQVPNSAAYFTKAAAIFAAGEGYTVQATDSFTQAEYDAYWAGLQTTGVAFAQEIVDYVLANYVNDDYQDYFPQTPAEIKASVGLQVAAGMALWGFAAYGETGLTDITGKTYDLVETFPTANDYWAALKAGYSDDAGVVDYVNMNDTESAGMSLIGSADETFVSSNMTVGSVQNIAGLVKGSTVVDGESFETIKVVLTEQNPKAILSLGVTVAPKAYYTAGYTATAGAVVNAGVELGINGNDKFMKHLETFNSKPMGAGPYKFVSNNGDLVTFVRNDFHYTMGGDNVTNATIKNIALKIVESGAEFNALSAGDVHYATVSASADVMEDLAKDEYKHLTSVLVDNLGYGYICINPNGDNLANIHTRIALTSALNLEKMRDYYPSGLADVIYRAQSQVSWAYPEGAQAIYPFDATLATAIAEFKAAGYTFDETTKKFTDVPTFTFTLPSDAADHPAGGIFLQAKELLTTIGVNVEIKVDEDLIANIKTSAVQVYALAWSSAADPDMYQVYHYESAAESVISNGIKWLQENGSDMHGTIEVTKLDNSVETMTQTQALEYLAYLIEEGVKYMSVDERKPIYESALNLLAQLSIEIPTYQRKNLFAYDSNVIDATTLSDNVSPYWGPMAEIWKVSFKK